METGQISLCSTSTVYQRRTEDKHVTNIEKVSFDWNRLELFDLYVTRENA